MKSVDVPMSPCPHCGRGNDRAASEEGIHPKLGDVSMCASCGTICQFGEGLQLRRCEDLERLPPEIQQEAKRLREVWCYRETAERMGKFMLAWRRKHPRRRLKFRLPEVTTIGSVCDHLSKIALDQTTLDLVEKLRKVAASVPESPDNEPTFEMLRAALEVAKVPYEKAPITAFGKSQFLQRGGVA